jgi:DtxR family Mn-dependent transcriptional regulator
MSPMSGDLIDTTEMYLRTVFELEEEGIVPLRARIAERLGQSGPTVSQTVARMERDGLIRVLGDRHLEFTDRGREYATRVMRKHRLAECMLVQVIGLPWEEVHTEACRWEHVISDSVERRVFALLGNPTESPFGNPIPGLGELLDDAPEVSAGLGDLVTMESAVRGSSARLAVRRIGEPLQGDPQILAQLRAAGVVPGATVTVEQAADGVRVHAGAGPHTVPRDLIAHVYVDVL